MGNNSKLEEKPWKRNDDIREVIVTDLIEMRPDMYYGKISSLGWDLGNGDRLRADVIVDQNKSYLTRLAIYVVKNGAEKDASHSNWNCCDLGFTISELTAIVNKVLYGYYV